MKSSKNNKESKDIKKESKDQVYIPLEFKDSIDTVLECFESFPLDSEMAEIEGRIGIFDPTTNRFDSQVDPKWFAEKMAYFMAPGARWDHVEEETTTSYLFDGGVRAVQRQDETAIFVQKVRKASMDLRFKGCPLNVRIAYSLEIPKQPPSTTAIWVRMRHRKSFYTGPFRFDFSTIIEAKTHQEAQQKQEAKYEIEIEYISNQPGAPERTKSHDYLAVSMLFKLHDLVTPNGTDCSTDARPLEILQVKHKSNRF